MDTPDYPALFAAADQAAAQAQQRFYAWLAVNLVSLTAAAGLSAYAEDSTFMAFLQLVALVVGLGCTVYIEGIQPQRRWYRARALAESVKTLTWRHVMRAAPFDGEDPSARRKFMASLQKIVEENRPASAQAMANDVAEQITPAMERVRALPLADRVEHYRVARIEDQHAWYIRKAKQSTQTARFWFVLLVVFNGLAIGLCVFRLSETGREFWEQNFDGKWPIDLFTIAAGSVLTWIQTKRFQELATSYTLTAYEIGILKSDLPKDGSEARFAHFVADAENAFSREHTQWRARRDAE